MIAELPEHGLLLSFNETQLIIAPKRFSDLFHQLVKLSDSGVSDTLATKEPIRKSAKLRSGRIGLVLQHDPPLGGWSLTVGDLAEDQVELHYRSHFDHSPIQRNVTKQTWDASQLQRFEDHAALAFMEPTDIGQGLISHYLQALIGRPLLSSTFQKHIGPTKLLVIDGPQQASDKNLKYLRLTIPVDGRAG